MRKQFFSCTLSALLVVVTSSAEAQQVTKIPRIGFVTGGSANRGPQVEAFRRGLRDLGYVEGKTILVEYRDLEGKPERSSELVAELAQLKVDVIVVSPITAIRAAKEATKTIPIVMVTSQDPVAVGLVDSLARPGGNITGLTRLTREISGKRLVLLTEVIPGVSRVGVLGDAKLPGSAIAFKEYEVAARALKIQLLSIELRGPKPEFQNAFRSANKGRASALITIGNPFLNRYPKQIADLAIKDRLPMMCETSMWTEEGCLASYSSDEVESSRRAAIFVDKILKDAKTADLPVEQPMKFEFVINLKTAKQIGLTIPQSVLFRADKVIK
jgi:putative tryptophan/tyrosine transport system substrate-binding protein